jgi:hypothetical protein
MGKPYLIRRESGQEQPHWQVGPFKVRLPLVHYPLEMVEAVQALIMFVVGLAVIPLMQELLGFSFEVALAVTIVFMATLLLSPLLGVPFVPGFITPAIPLVVLFLADYEPGPEAVQALVALHILVAAIFLLLGVTKLAGRIVTIIPASIKGGILLGAGIAALAGEIEEGGRALETPWAIGVGAAVMTFTLFSLSFRSLYRRSKLAAFIANYGLVPGLLVAIGVGWAVGEYPLPDIEWGIVQPAFGDLWDTLPFTIGFPGPELFLAAIPTAILTYIIAYGDIIVGTAVLERSDEARSDEIIDIDQDRVHLVTGIRNVIHAFLSPQPGQGGPIWTALTASVATRYEFGRKAMESIYSGAGTFYLVGFFAIFMLPLVTLFQPVLPIALSLTLLITGYLCLVVGMQQVRSTEQMAVAGITGVAIATQGPAWGLAVGIVLHVLVERENLLPTGRARKQTETEDTKTEDTKVVE